MRVATTVAIVLLAGTIAAVAPAAASPRVSDAISDNGVRHGVVEVGGGFKFRGRHHGRFGHRGFYKRGFHKRGFRGGFGQRSFHKRSLHRGFGHGVGHGKFRHRGLPKGFRVDGFRHGAGKRGHHGVGRGIRHHAR